MSSIDEVLNHSVIDSAVRLQWFAESIVERYGADAVSQAQNLVQDMLCAGDVREGVDQNTCINLVARYMALPYNEDGGTLHLALIDKNWEREHILFCQRYAAAQGDPVGFVLSSLLLSLPDERLRQWIGKLEPDEHDSTCSAYYQPEKPCECGATL